jgi:hypothetical protein
MSASSWVWLHSKAAGSDKFVLLAIAWHLNTDGVAWPSIERLCDHTGLGRNTVLRAIAALQKLGELEVDVHGGPKPPGARRPLNLYRIKGSQIGTLSAGKGPNFGRKGSHFDPVKGPNLGPELKNRTKNGSAAARQRVLNGVDPANRDTWLGGQLPDE